jgi:hypothetical protein
MRSVTLFAKTINWFLVLIELLVREMKTFPLKIVVISEYSDSFDFEIKCVE